VSKKDEALKIWRDFQALNEAQRDAARLKATFAVFVKRPPWYRRAWEWLKNLLKEA
jgi:hypothetical protein